MKLLALVAAALALSAAVRPTVETYRIALPEGGLPEYWHVEFPPIPDAVSATLDLELRPRGRVEFENTTTAWPFPLFRPWAWLGAFPRVEAHSGIDLLHAEWSELSVWSKTVDRVFDGDMDHAGGSGSTVIVHGKDCGLPPTPVDPARLAGGLTLDVSAPAWVTMTVFGTHNFDLSAGAYLGGAVVLKVDR